MSSAKDPPAGLTDDDWVQLRHAVEASTFTHEAQLFGHSDIGEAGAGFGVSVSVDGDTAVVGESFRDKPGGGVNAGAAYVFVRSGTTWTEQQMLVPSDGAAADRFGFSVALSGDTLVVGAYRDDTTAGMDAGSAYVFVRVGSVWNLQQKILASDGGVGDTFGAAVSLSADTAVVGASRDDTRGGADTGSAYVFVRSGTTWTEQQKLVASDGAAFDEFGNAVSISADTVAVGAGRDDTPGGVDTGSAYVFVRSGTTWTEQQKLLASDGVPGDFFGGSVALDQDTVVVGTYAAHTHAGSAYVFVRSGTTWTEQQKLMASDATVGDGFGASVSLSGNVAAIGARFDDTADGQNAGSAYVFVRAGATWTEQQKLLASDGAASDRFGFSASVAGDTVVIGAQGDDVPGPNAGSALVFVSAGTVWTEQQKLLGSPPSETLDDEFGYAVSVSGDTVVIGADRDDTPSGVDAGSAYVFVRSGTGWTEQQKLMPTEGGPHDAFGVSVSVSGDTLVVGAWYLAAGLPGSAYVFVRSGTTWSEQQKLTAWETEGDDGFGWSVSIDGDTVVVGAYHDDTAASHAGAAYVFERSGTSWTPQQKLLASDAGGGDHFGVGVSVSGDTALVGAEGEGQAEYVGAAYVFVRAGTTWSQQQKLVASDGAADDFFGFSVSLSGDTAVVGAYGDDTPAGSSAGSAYVFVRSGTAWTQQQKLVASDGGQFNAFGVSVSVSGDVAVIGVPYDNTPLFDAGSAYVFMRSGSTWTQQQKLLAPAGAEQDYFGYSVSVAANTVIAGAPSAFGPGSAHVFGEGIKRRSRRHHDRR
jgi:hypothetical protein